jgi:hypothetical protein
VADTSDVKKWAQGLDDDEMPAIVTEEELASFVSFD